MTKATTLALFLGSATARYEGYTPGIKVRLEQQTLDSMKTVMEKFLPGYVNNDLQLPDSFHYELFPKLGAWGWIIDWTDITYSVVDLDIRDVKIELSRGYDLGLVKIDFPAIKHWEIDA